MSDTSSTTSSGTSGTSGTSSASDTSVGVTVTSNAEAQAAPPDTGRPTPPDVLGGDSIHRPGQAPGMSVLDGPATMTVGAHRKKSGKSSGGSSGSGSSGSSKKSS